jgi:hypothetical protein
VSRGKLTVIGGITPGEKPQCSGKVKVTDTETVAHTLPRRRASLAPNAQSARWVLDFVTPLRYSVLPLVHSGTPFVYSAPSPLDVVEPHMRSVKSHFHSARWRVAWQSAKRVVTGPQPKEQEPSAPEAPGLESAA